MFKGIITCFKIACGIDRIESAEFDFIAYIIPWHEALTHF